MADAVGRPALRHELAWRRVVTRGMRTLALVSLSIVLLTGFTAAQMLSDEPGAPTPEACGIPGQWRIPGQAEPVATESLIARIAGQRVALLGEEHDNAADHRWQLHTLAALHGRQPRLALGFEMFPRRLQAVLDDWVAGRLSEKAFLNRVEWDQVWGYDAALYLPLFHFARMHGVPMLALNVDRGLVSRVESQGWDALPAAEREGLGRPAKPSSDYLAQLRRVYDHHPGTRSDAGFARFAEAQTVWDRAMAEGIAAHLRRRPDDLVVAILGAGHVRHGHGVAHQLADLGVRPVANLITWEQRWPCAELVPGVADAVFVKRDDPHAVSPPRLGIAMESHADGVRIARVVADSVAERAGLQAGDLLLRAAGRTVVAAGEMRAVIDRQAPGTWLPLQVRRAGRELDLVARFPAD